MRFDICRWSICWECQSCCTIFLQAFTYPFNALTLWIKVLLILLQLHILYVLQFLESTHHKVHHWTLGYLHTNCDKIVIDQWRDFIFHLFVCHTLLFSGGYYREGWPDTVNRLEEGVPDTWELIGRIEMSWFFYVHDRYLKARLSHGQVHIYFEMLCCFC